MLDVRAPRAHVRVKARTEGRHAQLPRLKFQKPGSRSAAPPGAVDLLRKAAFRIDARGKPRVEDVLLEHASRGGSRRVTSIALHRLHRARPEISRSPARGPGG